MSYTITPGGSQTHRPNQWLPKSPSYRLSCNPLETTPPQPARERGYVITDPERLAQLDLPEGETAVVVLAAVLEEHFRAQR
ncbi:hypothetical protein [Streptomyces sp. AP-93]|uniref:hypothetical protein n=1 Tax=Streptomyces sp. AP-93 TaxID=2929048 RepID=UPI001FB0478C|nr:hypothetical protein [Streptomyces sp. AP-93]MCJ0874663.1 hypothetical protein [Streptomyces sp. AP-93]